MVINRHSSSSFLPFSVVDVLVSELPVIGTTLINAVTSSINLKHNLLPLPKSSRKIEDKISIHDIYKLMHMRKIEQECAALQQRNRVLEAERASRLWRSPPTFAPSAEQTLEENADTGGGSLSSLGNRLRRIATMEEPVATYQRPKRNAPPPPPVNQSHHPTKIIEEIDLTDMDD